MKGPVEAVFLVVYVFCIYVALPFAILRGWIHWAERPKSLTPFSVLSLLGFLLATCSVLLAFGGLLYARAIAGFPYYDPRLMRLYRWGGLLSMAGIFSGIYALAYLGIAEAAMGPARYRHPYLQMQQTARSAVLKALEIDPNLAQAHLDMARVEFWSGEWDTAEREFKRAIELDPENGKGHELFGEYLEATGRREQARLESQRLTGS